MSASRIDPVWQQLSEADAARVRAFWAAHGALPAEEEADARIGQVAAIARGDGGEVLGVASVVIDVIPQLQLRFGLMRAFVHPDHRAGHIGLALFHCVFAAVGAWSAARPAEEVMGIGGVIRSRELADWARRPWWPPTSTYFIGHSSDGRQVRIRWFDHARVPIG